jgi:hypothetical protein
MRSCSIHNIEARAGIVFVDFVSLGFSLSRRTETWLVPMPRAAEAESHILEAMRLSPRGCIHDTTYVGPLWVSNCLAEH